jgi:alcohol dehydrogenase
VLFEPETPVPMLEMYTVGMHLHAGRPMARPAIPHVLDLITSGRFDPGPITDRVVPWDEAGDALLASHTKLVFARD